MKPKPYKLFWLAIISILLSLTPALAQDIEVVTPNPTKTSQQPQILYYGKQLSPEEFRASIEIRDYNCIQQVNSQTLASRRVEVILCFDTEAEVNIQERMQQQFADRLNSTRPTIATLQLPVVRPSLFPIGSPWPPHWALYYNSFYNGHFLDLTCSPGGTTQITNTSFWSAWNDRDSHYLGTGTGPNFDGTRIKYLNSFGIPMYSPIRSAQILC